MDLLSQVYYCQINDKLRVNVSHKCAAEIERIKQLSFLKAEKWNDKTTVQNLASEKASALTQRQKVIAAFLLRYGVLNKPDEQTKDIKNEIYSFVGGGKDNFNRYLNSATKTTDEINSIRNRERDLKAVRNYIQRDLDNDADALALLKKSCCDVNECLEALDYEIDKLQKKLQKLNPKKNGKKIDKQ